MAQGIGRDGIIALGIESTYKTEAASANAVIQPLNKVVFEPVIEKVRNESATGSSYGLSGLDKTTQMATTTIETKFNENTLPVLLRSWFSISTQNDTPVVGAYTHTLAYAPSQTGLTIAQVDANRGAFAITGALLESFTITQEKDYLKGSFSYTGQYIASASLSGSASTQAEFNNNHMTFAWEDVGTGVAAGSIERYELSGSATLDQYFALGSPDIASQRITEVSELLQKFTLLMPDYTYRTEFAGDQAKVTKTTITDTSTARYITGTTSPSIVFDTPISYISSFAENSDLAASNRQDLEVLAVDAPSTADAPMKITIVNGISAYAAS